MPEDLKATEEIDLTGIGDDQFMSMLEAEENPESIQGDAPEEMPKEELAKPEEEEEYPDPEKLEELLKENKAGEDDPTEEDKPDFQGQIDALSAEKKTLEETVGYYESKFKEVSEKITPFIDDARVMEEMKALLDRGLIGEFKGLVKLALDVDLDLEETKSYNSSEEVLKIIKGRLAQQDLKKIGPREDQEREKARITQYFKDFSSSRKDLSESQQKEIADFMSSSDYNNPEIAYMWQNKDKILADAGKKAVSEYRIKLQKLKKVVKPPQGPTGDHGHLSLDQKLKDPNYIPSDKELAEERGLN
jgi:hypothetical protein